MHMLGQPATIPIPIRAHTSGDKGCVQPATIQPFKSLKLFLQTLQAHS